MRVKRGLLILVLSSFLAISLSACSMKVTVDSNANKKATTDKNTIELEGAKEAEINISMGVGELRVEKSTDKMMEGQFIYTREDWKPEVEYKVEGEKGILNISQPPSKSVNISLGQDKYNWDLSFNKDIPIDMEISMGVGEAEVNLRELNMRSLKVESGVGEATIDLTGNYKNDVEVDIEGGVGATTIYLPKDIGVKIDAEKGVGNIDAEGFTKKDGEYINENYGKTENSIIVDIEVGVGDLEIKLK